MNIFRVLGAVGLAASLSALGQPAQAQEKMMGEIFMTGANYCPRGSMKADGQLLPIAEYSAMFSLFGTVYGGDGRTTFALPDLRGRVPVGTGSGPGLTARNIGRKIGAETQTLTVAPAHAHGLNGSTPAGEAAASPDADADGIPPAPAVPTDMIAGTQAVSVLDPSLAINFCVAINGFYPSRN